MMKTEMEHFRMTKPREVVLSILSSKREHLTADEIFNIAKKIYPGIGFASVYRSLRLFEKEGIVEVIFVNGRKKRFQLKHRREKVKIHLICTNRGKIMDFSGRNKEVKEFVREIEKVLLEKYSFRLSTLEMQIFGECMDSEEGR
jgi:Fe2+ or Zn2+ uptake regulation protein